jgi:hypothetical protein
MLEEGVSGDMRVSRVEAEEGRKEERKGKEASICCWRSAASLSAWSNLTMADWPHSTKNSIPTTTTATY